MTGGGGLEKGGFANANLLRRFGSEYLADWDALLVYAAVRCHRRRLLRDDVQWFTYSALNNILCTP